MSYLQLTGSRRIAIQFGEILSYIDTVSIGNRYICPFSHPFPILFHPFPILFHPFLVLFHPFPVFSRPFPQRVPPQNLSRPQRSRLCGVCAWRMPPLCLSLSTPISMRLVLYDRREMRRYDPGRCCETGRSFLREIQVFLRSCSGARARASRLGKQTKQDYSMATRFSNKLLFVSRSAAAIRSAALTK